MWIYAFGSLVRGEMDEKSDIDILHIYSSSDKKHSPQNILKYSKDEIKKYFKNGDLFAHHLYSESKLIYTSDGIDLIRSLGKPAPYSEWKKDLSAFIEVALYSIDEIAKKGQSVFRNGLLYMSLRDIAMIYSQEKMNITDFSKYVPYHIDINLEMTHDEYESLRLCRLSSTRGYNDAKIYFKLHKSCFLNIKNWVFKIKKWMEKYD